LTGCWAKALKKVNKNRLLKNGNFFMILF